MLTVSDLLLRPLQPSCLSCSVQLFLGLSNSELSSNELMQT